VRPRAVVQYTDTVAFGGAEQVLLHLLRTLDRDRWRPLLLHHDAPGLQPLLEGADAAGIERHRVAPIRGPRGIAAVPSFVRALNALKPAVFHAHLNWPLGCSGGILAAALSRVPAVVATVHLFSGFPRAATIPLQRRVVPRLVGRYIAVSEAVVRDIERGLGVPRTRIRCVPNGIAVDAFERGTAADPAVRRQATGDTGRPTVVTLARLDRHKGLGTLLQAAALLPDVTFVIAGEGPERHRLEAEARALGVSERVSLPGFQRDPARLLASADVFVLPSLLEGHPLSVLEAMAAGTPVVATSIPGTAEIVSHGVTGVLVPPGNPAALAAAVKELLEDRALAERLAIAGRELVRRRFTAGAMTRSVANVYEELLAERGTVRV
jgi:glycosyltransferase involved in cell wall biosynthesis